MKPSSEVLSVCFLDKLVVTRGASHAMESSFTLLLSTRAVQCGGHGTRLPRWLMAAVDELWV